MATTARRVPLVTHPPQFLIVETNCRIGIFDVGARVLYVPQPPISTNYDNNDECCEKRALREDEDVMLVPIHPRLFFDVDVAMKLPPGEAEVRLRNFHQLRLYCLAGQSDDEKILARLVQSQVPRGKDFRVYILCGEGIDGIPPQHELASWVYTLTIAALAVELARPFNATTEKRAPSSAKKCILL